MLPGGWLRTGDVGRMDEGGFVFIEDRKKDMILVSGFNVYPNEIENVVVEMDGILEAAAIGRSEPESLGRARQGLRRAKAWSATPGHGSSAMCSTTASPPTPEPDRTLQACRRRAVEFREDGCRRPTSARSCVGVGWPGDWRA